MPPPRHVYTQHIHIYTRQPLERPPQPNQPQIFKINPTSAYLHPSSYPDSNMASIARRPWWKGQVPGRMMDVSRITTQNLWKRHANLHTCQPQITTALRRTFQVSTGMLIAVIDHHADESRHHVVRPKINKHNIVPRKTAHTKVQTTFVLCLCLCDITMI